MIDGGIFLGYNASNGQGWNDLAPLLARLDANGIDRALAASFESVVYDFRSGNRATLTAVAAAGGRLLPMATLCLPGFDAAEGYLEQLKAESFVALGLFPHMQFWSFEDYCLAEIGRQAAACGLPLQIGVNDRVDLARAARALGPTGATVLVRWMRGRGYYCVPDMIAVAQDFPRFVFDVSAIMQSGGIEYLVCRLGAHRLFVASNLPTALEAAPLFTLEAADITEAERAMIAAGTLARVLELDQPPPRRPHPQWAAFRDLGKIDTHWHTGSWNTLEPKLAPADMAREWDRFNYRLVLSSSIQALNHDLAKGNADTAALCRSDRRARGLIVVDPLRVEQSLAEIAKYRDCPDFVGIKSIQDFHHSNGRPLSLEHPGFTPILAAAGTAGLTLMAHLPGMAERARAHPDLIFVAAHGTWRHGAFRDLPNVFIDIATSSHLRTEVDFADMFAAVGSQRALFSSDGQLMNPAWTLGKLASSGFSLDFLTDLFQKNALNAFPRLKDSRA